MSERGSFRGGRGGGRGGRGGQKSGGGGGAQEKPKKENILDLNKYMDKEVQVKFNGGREGMSNLSILFSFSTHPPFDCLLLFYQSELRFYMIYMLTPIISHRNPQGLRPAHEPGPR